jgi:hypothetical protein
MIAALDQYNGPRVAILWRHCDGEYVAALRGPANAVHAHLGPKLQVLQISEVSGVAAFRVQ